MTPPFRVSLGPAGPFPHNAGVTLIADSQALADAAGDPTLVGRVAQYLCRFEMVGTKDRSGPVWIDTTGRLRAWAGWHDLTASGSVHRAWEVKTSVPLTDPFNPDELVTRLSLRTEDPNNADSRYAAAILNWLTNLELNWGHQRLDTALPLKWRMPVGAPNPDGTNPGTTADVALISPQVNTDGTILLGLDLGLGSSSGKWSANKNGTIRLFRDTDTGTGTAFFVIFKGDGTNTEAVRVNAKTGQVDVHGPINAPGQDGTTLKPVVVDDDPRLSAGAITVASLGTDFSKTADAGAADVTGLSVAVAKNATYVIDADLLVTGATTGDMALSWSMPSGATLDWIPGGPSTSATSASSTPPDVGVRTSGSSATVGMVGSTIMVRPHGILRVGNTAGTLQLRMAQAVSDPTASTIKANSLLRAQRIA